MPLKEGAIESVLSEELEEQLEEQKVMTATDKLDVMRFKLRFENQFFVPLHEMGSDALLNEYHISNS